MKWNMTDIRLRRPRLSVPTTTASAMMDVIVALLPALGMAVYFFGPRVLALSAVSMICCILSEGLYRRFTRQPGSLRDLSACVTGLLLAMCLPPAAPYWAPALGAFFSIVVVKQFYGGLGRNFMNPALAGRMLLATFPLLMTTWPQPMQWLPLWGSVDVVTGATPLAYLKSGQLSQTTLSQLLVGQHGGSIGELSAIMLLLGGGYLVLRRVISARIPLAFLGTVALLTFLFPQEAPRLSWMAHHLLSGGLLLGAIFMATDYATSPSTPAGQVIYGVGCGALTVLLRYFSSYPEGVGFAILTMNCGVWLMDRVGRPRRFGVPPFADLVGRLQRAAKSMEEIRLVVPKIKLPLATGRMPGEAHLDEVRKAGKTLLVAGGMLLVTVAMIFGVHRMTERTVHQQTEQQNREILTHVMPQAEMMTETSLRAPDAVSISAGYRDNNLIGYCVQVQVSGFVGSISMVVGVSNNGQVTGAYVLSGNETVGMGAQALEQEYLDRFVGRSGTIRIPGPGEADAISSATVTAKAIITGINRALAVVANLDHEQEVPYADGEV